MRLFSKDIFYLILGPHQVWGLSNGKQIFSTTYPSDNSPQSIAELFPQKKYSKIILLLEYPWVMNSHEQLFTSLNNEEITQYIRNRFQTPHILDSSVGFCFLEDGTQFGALFCSMMSFATQALIKVLQKLSRTPIESIPLTYLCIPELQQYPNHHILLETAAKYTFIQTQRGKIQQWVNIHATDRQQALLLLADMKQLETQQLTCLTISVNQDEATNTLTIENLISQGQFSQTSTRHPFSWNVQKSQNLAKYQKSLLIAVPSLLISGILIWHQYTRNSIDHIKTELTQAMLKTDERRIQLQLLNDYTAQQNHFLQVNALYQHLKTYSSLAHSVLDQIISPIQGVWVKSLDYQDGKVEVALFTIDPELIPQVLVSLKSNSLIQNVHFKLQQKVELYQREVTEFVLNIELKHTIFQ
ncbi:MAG: hypothetical protein HQM11_07055 [SAR324 cluster bacterium]|nr:hypothetical protein [SAR324 cluster bacterium]